MLLVEPRAGQRGGHYMTRLEALTRAMHELGHQVHVLTGSPLAIEAEGRTLDDVATVHVASERWRRIDRWSQRMLERPPRRVRRAARFVAGVTRQLAFHRMVRSCAQAIGDPPVLVLSTTLSVGPAALLAPRDARLTLYEVLYRRGGVEPPRRAMRLASRGIAWRERRRRRAGGWVRLIATSDFGMRTWTTRHPWLDATVIAPAAIRDVVAAPREAARADLGIRPGERVGLLFGTAHARKDVETVFLAFAGDRPPGRLLAAGTGMQRALDEVRRRHPSATFAGVTVLDGPQTDRVKHLLHSAADYVIVSTKPGVETDSGTLSDAVSYHLPVCCSDDGEPGRLVAEHGLGLTFAGGDPSALRRTAARLTADDVDPAGRAAIMLARSDREVARRFIDVVLRPDYERRS